MATPQAQVMLPTFGIGIEQGADGKHYLMLEIGTGYTRHTFYIGDQDSYAANAAAIHKGIMDAGKDLARLNSGLITMNGDGGDLREIAASLRRKEGRK